MIYFVDEDVGQIGAWADSLEERGYETVIIRDADLAFDKLHDCKDVELVFIDVMLACNPDKEKRRYNQEETEDYQSTGLNLLEDLSQQNPDVFPLRAILLSQTGKKRILNKIETACKKMKMPFWKKSSFNDPFEFLNKTEAYLKIFEPKQ